MTDNRKGLVILPTQEIVYHYPRWGELLHRFEQTWADFFCTVVTPLLDEVSRNGVSILLDTDIGDPGYIGEIAYETIVALILGDEADPETVAIPPEQQGIFGQMYAEAHVIIRDILLEVGKYTRLALDADWSIQRTPTAIMYDRMMGQDLVLAIYFTDFTPYPLSAPASSS